MSVVATPATIFRHTPNFGEYMKSPITLRVNDADHCKRIKDPFDPNLHHLETLLPFSEVNKLVPGNANVRRPKESSKPYQEMIKTVEKNPQAFHVKNRGITFICASFEVTHTQFRGSAPFEHPPRKRR